MCACNRSTIEKTVPKITILPRSVIQGTKYSARRRETSTGEAYRIVDTGIGQMDQTGHTCLGRCVSLDDQTQVDLKPAGQPEHASLNQCQLIAANRLKLVLWAPPAGGGDKVPQ